MRRVYWFPVMKSALAMTALLWLRASLQRDVSIPILASSSHLEDSHREFTNVPNTCWSFPFTMASPALCPLVWPAVITASSLRKAIPSQWPGKPALCTSFLLLCYLCLFRRGTHMFSLPIGLGTMRRLLRNPGANEPWVGLKGASGVTLRTLNGDQSLIQVVHMMGSFQPLVSHNCRPLHVWEN